MFLDIYRKLQYGKQKTTHSYNQEGYADMENTKKALAIAILSLTRIR